MKDLKELFAALGFRDVKTYLQSGNIVYKGAGSSVDQSSKIQTAILKEFGHDVSVLVFSGNDFVDLASSNPFIGKKGIDEAFLHLTFLFDDEAEAITETAIPKMEGEEAVFNRGHYFLYCPNGYGRTKINNTYFERSLKVPATTRNWRTVNALLAMLD